MKVVVASYKLIFLFCISSKMLPVYLGFLFGAFGFSLSESGRTVKKLSKKKT